MALASLLTFYDLVHAIITALLAVFVYIYSPYLLPRTAIPHIAAALHEALQEVQRAEEIGAIESPSSARRTLDQLRSFHVSYLAMT
jgi:hypothetical protein